jgi:hypothetical protein
MEGVERCVKGVDQVQYRKVVDDHPLVQIVRVAATVFWPSDVGAAFHFPTQSYNVIPPWEFCLLCQDEARHVQTLFDNYFILVSFLKIQDYLIDSR